MKKAKSLKNTFLVIPSLIPYHSFKGATCTKSIGELGFPTLGCFKKFFFTGSIEGNKERNNIFVINTKAFKNIGTQNAKQSVFQRIAN